jgi:hypothetical protein
MLAIGYWLLAIGYWLLAIGYWILDIGYWLLKAERGGRVAPDWSNKTQKRGLSACCLLLAYFLRRLTFFSLTEAEAVLCAIPKRKRKSRGAEAKERKKKQEADGGFAEAKTAVEGLIHSKGARTAAASAPLGPRARL